MSQTAGRYRHAGELTGEAPTREFAEISIPMPWGHIAGKWYGPQNVRPILAMHGWQDNCGTYDLLVPLLAPEVAFLAIDLPGHGLSSRLPDGCYYNNVDNLYVIRLIMKQYNWQKVSLVGHSMSAIICFVFAAVFPDKVDMIISLDALKPHQRPISSITRTMERRLEEFLREDERNRSKNEPPSYTFSEVIERLHKGSYYSMEKRVCKYMSARNIQKSEKYPEKYFFCRDRRLLYYNYTIASQELCVEMAKTITCPYLFIKGKDSPYFEDRKYYDEVLEIMLKHSHFEFLETPGTHHFHMNNPETFVDTVNKFLLRHGPIASESSTASSATKRESKL